jgi:hypothetical protein
MQHNIGDDRKLDNSVQEVTTYILDKAPPHVVHKEMPLPRGVFVFAMLPGDAHQNIITEHNFSMTISAFVKIKNFKMLKCVFVTR